MPPAGRSVTHRPARPSPDRSLRVALVEPFHDGSHRAFAEGLRRHSRHRITLVTLPGQRWRWRLRWAALGLAERVKALRPRPDVLLLSSLLDAAHLLALLGRSAPPAALYLHENQLAYPVPEGKGSDLQLGIANLASGLACREVWFNSRYHRDEFLGRLPRFLRELPPPRPAHAATTIRRRSRVLVPGVSLPPEPKPRPPGSPPVVLWNHRWEFDKNPGAFFRVCYQLEEGGVPFRLVLLGSNHQFVPKPFLTARERLAHAILHYGYAPGRRDYLRWLAASDIVVSTAGQENFGMAVVEAVAAGCYPLLPAALSYPGLLPASLHRDHLYRGLPDLLRRLEALLRHPERLAAGVNRRRRAMARFDWARRSPAFDAALCRIAGRR